MRKGFTLVELLVTIAVIALLLSVLFPNFVGARQRARDARRKADLAEIQKALELYKSDQNPPVYPSTGALGSNLCQQCWSSGADCSGNIYMKKVPCDPFSGGPLSALSYFYERDASDPLRYRLFACLENPVDGDRDPTPNPTCAFRANTSYTLTEP